MTTISLSEIIEQRQVSGARKVTLRGVVKIIEEMGVSEIDNMFYAKYMNALNAKGYNPNTKGKMVSSLKSLLPETVSTKGWKVPKQETDNIYLNEVELELLYKCNRVEGTTEIVRDIFILLAFTGLRVSDYAKLNTAIIEDGMFKIRAKKVGTYSYIPVHPYVKAVLKKYDYNVPLLSNMTINVHIKRACLLAGIKSYAEVKSHTGRRSCLTNLYLKKVPADTIMLLSGHKQVATLLGYVKCSVKEKLEMIKKVWK